MDPVSVTPTRPVDYALLSGTYGSLLALSSITARGNEPIRHADMVPLAAATFALSKLLVHEKVESWIRHPFVEESAEGKRPKGAGIRYAIGELLTCTRCAGAWSALALVSLRAHAPVAASTVTAVLTVSACNDFLHSSFSWLNARSNHSRSQAEIAEASVLLERERLDGAGVNPARQAA